MAKFVRSAGFAALAAVTILSGCSSLDRTTDAVFGYGGDPRYAAVVDDGILVPEIPPQYLTDENTRQVVPFAGDEAPGTIVVDTADRFLYHVQSGGQAMRYRIGVGRAGYAFSGGGKIGRKAEWPGWTPTQNMLNREPDRYGQFADGVPGGLNNPLGARAMYLYRNGRDTYFRIHGTNEPHTIGHSVSAGCIRMYNQDAIHLESQVEVGSRVVVRPVDQIVV